MTYISLTKNVKNLKTLKQNVPPGHKDGIPY